MVIGNISDWKTQNRTSRSYVAKKASFALAEQEKKRWHL
jgi:hypothetical protein